MCTIDSIKSSLINSGNKVTGTLNNITSSFFDDPELKQYSDNRVRVSQLEIKILADRISGKSVNETEMNEYKNLTDKNTEYQAKHMSFA